jgi:hypothetical protein
MAIGHALVVLAGHGPTLLAGLRDRIQLETTEPRAGAR